MPSSFDMVCMIFTAGFVFSLGHRATGLIIETWGPDLERLLCITGAVVVLPIAALFLVLFNLNKDKIMKRILIMVLIGASIGALIGAGVGLFWHPILHATGVGTVAGAVGVLTSNKWPGWFTTAYVHSWRSSVLLIFCCVMLGGAVGAMAGWSIRGLGMGALFGVIVVGVEFFLRKDPIKVW